LSFDADTQACAALTERGDPDRFAATMALPVALRGRLFPLWAFNIEVARAPWVTQEPLIAQMRLQWWHDALEEIAAGGFIRRHEVVTPLALWLTPEQARRLQDLVTARHSDIENTPFEEEAALTAYLDATAGNLHAVAAGILGAPDAEAAGRVARTIGLANWLRALPELEARGRRPLPDGRAETLARMARTGLDDLAEQRGLSRAARQALLAGFQARPLLRRVARHPGAVAQNRLHLSPLSRSLHLIAARLSGRI
jgi:phytoene/squalene synthetase